MNLMHDVPDLSVAACVFGSYSECDSDCIAGVTAHAADEGVLLALKIAWALPRDDLMAWEAGVRNRQGKIYRRAAFRGVAQVLYFEEHMETLGFVPELEQSEHAGSSGFDLIFRDPLGSGAL